MSELSPMLNNESAAPAAVAATPVKPAAKTGSAVMLGMMALLIALASAALVGWFFYVWQPQLVALQQQQQTLQNQQQSQTALFQTRQEELQQEMDVSLRVELDKERGSLVLTQ